MNRLEVFISAVPGTIGLASRVVKFLGERSRYERSRRALSLLKLKYEIEALRKKNSLEVPSLEIEPGEVDKIRLLELPWSDPRRIHSDFWPRYIRGARWKALLALGGIGLLALLCLSGAITVSVIMLTSGNLQDEESAILLFIWVMDLTIGYFSLTNCIEIYRALVLTRK